MFERRAHRERCTQAPWSTLPHGFGEGALTEADLAADHPAHRLIRLNQKHTADIYCMEDEAPGDQPLDAAIAARPDVLLTIRTADCLPILLYDPEHASIGAVHAGWRGAAAGIVRKTVETMGDAYGTVPGELHALLGPHIRGERYQVGADVAAAVRGDGEERWLWPDPAATPDDPRWRFDLGAYCIRDLTAAGLDPARILVHPACTFADSRFPSYRRDGTGCGRLLSWIALPRS